MIVRSSRWLSLSRMSTSFLWPGSRSAAPASIWTEPEIAASGLPDLVRQAGGELAHRRHAVLQPHLLLEAPPARQVLEDDDVAALDPLGVGELREREAEIGGRPAALRTTTSERRWRAPRRRP